MSQKVQVQRLESNRLKKLAEDPQNLVYHYVDRPKLTQAVPIRHVRSMVTKLWNNRKNIAHIQEPRYRRQEMCALDSDFETFSETHPGIFDRLVHTDATEKDFETILQMLEVYETKGNTNEGKQEFSKLVFSKYAVPKEEYLNQHPDHELYNFSIPSS